MALVFVYGTLRKGECNHYLLQGAACLAEQAKTRGLLYDAGLGYPAMEESEAGWVYGELYEADGRLDVLDELEGYIQGSSGSEYERITQTVYTDQGEFQAFVYVAGKNKVLLKQRIEHGDWRLHNLYRGKNSVLYFAYGSCMDMKRFELAGVAGHFREMLGQAKLHGYKVRFTFRMPDGGRADIVEEDGTVEGKLYRLPLQALNYLYAREGVEEGCYRPAVITVEYAGKMVDNVLTFIVINKEKEEAPPDHYASELMRGGAGVLSSDYMEELRRHISLLTQQRT